MRQGARKLKTTGKTIVKKHIFAVAAAGMVAIAGASSAKADPMWWDGTFVSGLAGYGNADGDIRTNPLSFNPFYFSKDKNGTNGEWEFNKDDYKFYGDEIKYAKSWYEFKTEYPQQLPGINGDFDWSGFVGGVDIESRTVYGSDNRSTIGFQAAITFGWGDDDASTSESWRHVHLKQLYCNSPCKYLARAHEAHYNETADMEIDWFGTVTADFGRVLDAEGKWHAAIGGGVGIVKLDGDLAAALHSEEVWGKAWKGDGKAGIYKAWKHKSHNQVFGSGDDDYGFGPAVTGQLQRRIGDRWAFGIKGRAAWISDESFGAFGLLDDKYKSYKTKMVVACVEEECNGTRKRTPDMAYRGLELNDLFVFDVLAKLTYKF